MFEGSQSNQKHVPDAASHLRDTQGNESAIENKGPTEGRKNLVICEILQYWRKLARSPSPGHPDSYEHVKKIRESWYSGLHVLANSAQSISMFRPSLAPKRFVMSGIKAAFNVHLHDRLGLSLRCQLPSVG
jgi:hypothetical protein